MQILLVLKRASLCFPGTPGSNIVDIGRLTGLVRLNQPEFLAYLFSRAHCIGQLVDTWPTNKHPALCSRIATVEPFDRKSRHVYLNIR